MVSVAVDPISHIDRSMPLGATVCHEGVNFSLFSRKASAVELLFFDRRKMTLPSDVISIDPYANRTYHYWHVFVPECCRTNVRISSPRTI